MLPGMVPEIEEREAARFGGVPWADWERLPRVDRIDGVAHFRLSRLIDLHQSDAHNAELKRRANQRTGTRRMR